MAASLLLSGTTGASGVITTPAPRLLTNERGGPVPPSDVLARVREYSPSLGLRFMPEFDRSRWALTWEWPVHDRRWARVQSSEIPRDAAYDIIGYLPIDCPLDQAAGYIETHLKNYPIEEIRRLHRKTVAWNATEIPKQQVAQLVTDTLDDTARATRQQNPRRKRVPVPTPAKATPETR